jgi:hypothetical protein
MLALVLVSGSACDEGDPGGGSVVCVEFTADQAPTSGEVTALMSDETTCEAVIVELVVTDVNDVFGLQTMITYDTSIAQFAGWDSTNSVLRADGSEVASVVREIAAGELEVGVTRVLGDGIDVTGSAKILEVVFLINRNTEGAGSFTLEQECLWGSEDPPEPKLDVACSGGRLVVR